MEATQKDFADMHNERDEALMRIEGLEEALERIEAMSPDGYLNDARAIARAALLGRWARKT
jgi:hypothetical protein